MRKKLLIGILWLGILAAPRASIYYQGTGVSGDFFEGSVVNPTIFDGNPAAVIANTMTLSGLGASLSSLTVTLNVSGGNDSGLYAYLAGPGSTTVILMNQPGVAVNGFGATGAGMNLTLQDGTVANGSIQYVTSGLVLGGTYNAGGSLSDFNGGNPNGTWTLYFADTIAGGGNASLNGWSLNITAVPEPVNMALIIFSTIMLVLAIFHREEKEQICRK